MNTKDSCAISVRCVSKEGALETLQDTERLLTRIPSASVQLRSLPSWIRAGTSRASASRRCA